VGTVAQLIFGAGISPPRVQIKAHLLWLDHLCTCQGNAPPLQNDKDSEIGRKESEGGHAFAIREWRTQRVPMHAKPRLHCRAAFVEGLAEQVHVPEPLRGPRIIVRERSRRVI